MEDALVHSVVEMGLSIEEFWNLTWYEWALRLMRFNKVLEKQKFEAEIKWSHTRALMAVIANASPNRTGKYKPEDFIKLSFDKPEVESDEPDPNLFKKLKEMYGSKIKVDNVG